MQIDTYNTSNTIRAPQHADNMTDSLYYTKKHGSIQTKMKINPRALQTRPTTTQHFFTENSVKVHQKPPTFHQVD